MTVAPEISRKMRELGALGNAVRQEHLAAGRPRGRTPETQERREEQAKPLEELAEIEIRRQIRHRDPGIRRDASKLALELAKGKYSDQDGEPINEIVFRTIPLTPAEFEPPKPPPPPPKL